MEDSINTVIPLNLCFSKLPIRVQKVSKFMKCLNKHELFLALSLQLYTFLVVRDHHACIDLVTLLFGFYLEVLAALFKFLNFQALCFDTKLEVKFSALLNRLFT